MVGTAGVGVVIPTVELLGVVPTAVPDDPGALVPGVTVLVKGESAAAPATIVPLGATLEEVAPDDAASVVAVPVTDDPEDTVPEDVVPLVEDWAAPDVAVPLPVLASVPVAAASCGLSDDCVWPLASVDCDFAWSLPSELCFSLLCGGVCSFCCFCSDLVFGPPAAAFKMNAGVGTKRMAPTEVTCTVCPGIVTSVCTAPLKSTAVTLWLPSIV